MHDLNQIERILVGVDEQLRKALAFTDVIREIKGSLEELRNSQEQTYLYELKKLRQEMECLKNELHKHGVPKTSNYEQELQEIRSLLDVEWPIAVAEECITRTPKQIEQRSEGILDMFVCEHLKDKRFLDYGCGESCTAIKALEREASFALGYDIDPTKNNSKHFTSKFEDVKKNAPYDIVVLHDVLDHIVVIDPIQALQQIKSILSPKGTVYVKNHPWSSRHGGHVYNQMNKAFIHLAFDDIELTRIGGLTADHNIKVTTPLETYRYWFKEAGFNIISEIPIKEKVEPFFLSPSALNERIKKNWSDPTTMINHMEISFVEYTLNVSESEQEIF